jgi:hypothetical protein
MADNQKMTMTISRARTAHILYAFGAALSATISYMTTMRVRMPKKMPYAVAWKS